MEHAVIAALLEKYWSAGDQVKRRDPRRLFQPALHRPRT